MRQKIQKKPEEKAVQPVQPTKRKTGIERLEPLSSRVESMVGEKEIERLLEGNRRYVEGRMEQKNLPEKNRELLNGQHPFVTMLTCSDSRVIPSYIFDANIGDIFKVETAGNILDKVCIGSIEYGVGHLHTPLLVVLAHTKCGAITAACSEGHAEGNLAAVIKKIKPAAKKAENNVDKAIDINAKMVINELLRKSEIVRKAAEEGKLRIVAMKYDLETMEVRLLE
ncbi:MAG: carbonic anhydrase [Candidatus Bilamarchaeaceae archaeon]